MCHVVSATLPSLVALMIERRRRFGVIFIYLFNLKPVSLVFLEETRGSRKSMVAVTPHWKEVGSKAAWPDMGKHFHREWTDCLSKGYSHRVGTADHISSSNNMKGQDLATVTHIHVFLSNRGKWETPATARCPHPRPRLITCGGWGEQGGKGAFS